MTGLAAYTSAAVLAALGRQGTLSHGAARIALLTNGTVLASTSSFLLCGPSALVLPSLPPCSSAHGALRLSPSRPCAVQSGPRLLRRFTADQGTGTLAMACVTCKGLRCQAVAPFRAEWLLQICQLEPATEARGLQIEGATNQTAGSQSASGGAHWGLHGRSGAPSDISTAPFRAHCPRPQAHRPFRSALSPHSIRA